MASIWECAPRIGLSLAFLLLYLAAAVSAAALKMTQEVPDNSNEIEKRQYFDSLGGMAMGKRQYFDSLGGMAMGKRQYFDSLGGMAMGKRHFDSLGGLALGKRMARANGYWSPVDEHRDDYPDYVSYY